MSIGIHSEVERYYARFYFVVVPQGYIWSDFSLQEAEHMFRVFVKETRILVVNICAHHVKRQT
jgi:hypothetical protein